MLWFASWLALVLMWLALDDITTGDEPSQFGEWLVVLLGTVWFVGVGVWLRRKSS